MALETMDDAIMHKIITTQMLMFLTVFLKALIYPAASRKSVIFAMPSTFSKAFTTVSVSSRSDISILNESLNGLSSLRPSRITALSPNFSTFSSKICSFVYFSTVSTPSISLIFSPILSYFSASAVSFMIFYGFRYKCKCLQNNITL